MKTVWIITLASLLVPILAPEPALPQEIGLYFTPFESQPSYTSVPPLETVEFFMVLYVEDRVNAVAYDLQLQHGPGFYLQSAQYGPDGGGLLIEGPGGDNVGLGQCVLGYGGQAIVVAHYTGIFAAPDEELVVTLAPNYDESPVGPVYSDCTGATHPTTNVSPQITVNYGILSGPSVVQADGDGKFAFENILHVPDDGPYYFGDISVRCLENCSGGHVVDGFCRGVIAAGDYPDLVQGSLIDLGLPGLILSSAVICSESMYFSTYFETVILPPTIATSHQTWGSIKARW